MANISRWDPFNEMLSLRDAVNQLFEESFVSPSRMAGGGASTLPLNVSETDDKFIVDAVVPGVKPENLDITLQDNVLMITAETQQQEEFGGQKANYHRIERRYGRASRAISLPTPVNADQVQATLENGILHLEVPKAEEVKPRKITVGSGGQSSRTLDVSTEGAQSS